MSAAIELANDDLARTRNETVLALPHGIHPAVPEAFYHARHEELASKHGLDLLAQAPAVFKAWTEYEDVDDEERPALSFGRALHMRQLEPERFTEHYVIEPEWGPLRKTDSCSSEEAKANKTRRAEWRAEHAGANILTGADALRTMRMINAIAAHKAARLFEGGDSEVTLRWRDPATGVECKARVDHWRSDLACAIDVKGCADPSTEAFQRAVERYGYHHQAAFYDRGFEILNSPIRALVFVCVGTQWPHLVKMRVLDVPSIRKGHQWCDEQLATHAECLGSGIWPGLGNEIEVIGIRPWAR